MITPAAWSMSTVVTHWSNFFGSQILIWRFDCRVKPTDTSFSRAPSQHSLNVLEFSCACTSALTDPARGSHSRIFLSLLAVASTPPV